MKKPIFFIRKIFHKTCEWTEEEDKIITENGKLCQSKNDWKNLSIKLNKNTEKCVRRFNIKNPLIKKGRWTEEEDIKLLNLVEKYGRYWTLISTEFVTRNPKQVKNRYENSLNPCLLKKKFSKQDDQLMLKLFDLFGNKWSMYLNYFPNCSIKRIKNRFMRIHVKEEKNEKNEKISEKNEKIEKISEKSNNNDLNNIDKNNIYDNNNIISDGNNLNFSNENILLISCNNNYNNDEEKFLVEKNQK